VAFTPGSGSLELPADVGLEIGAGRFIVEAHYRNTSNSAGVESAGFCAEFTQPRAHTAAITRLGKQGIIVPPRSRDSFESTCSPSGEPFALILSTTFDVGSLPKNAKMVVERGTGTEVLVDRPEYNLGEIQTVPTVVSITAGQHRQDILPLREREQRGRQHSRPDPLQLLGYRIRWGLSRIRRAAAAAATEHAAPICGSQDSRELGQKARPRRLATQLSEQARRGSARHTRDESPSRDRARCARSARARLCENQETSALPIFL
jgi:hypothetical protein